MEFFRVRHFPLFSESYVYAEGVTIGDCFTIAKLLCKAFREGQYREIHIAYTNFVSVLSQIPNTRTLLPLSAVSENQGGNKKEILYEPDSTSVFESIIPEYLGGVLYGALCESRASEQAARRSAMDTATQNAEEIAKLREEIAKAAQTSKEEAAKRERAINLELISRGQEPLSPIELTPEEDAELVRKGALAAPE